MLTVTEFTLARAEVLERPRLANNDQTATPAPIISLEIDRDSRLLSAQYNHTGDLVLCALVDPEARPRDVRHFAVLLTGDALPDRIRAGDRPQRVRMGNFVHSTQTPYTSRTVHVIEMVPY